MDLCIRLKTSRKPLPGLKQLFPTKEILFQKKTIKAKRSEWNNFCSNVLMPTPTVAAAFSDDFPLDVMRTKDEQFNKQSCNCFPHLISPKTSCRKC